MNYIAQQSKITNTKEQNTQHGMSRRKGDNYDFSSGGVRKVGSRREYGENDGG